MTSVSSAWVFAEGQSGPAEPEIHTPPKLAASKHHSSPMQQPSREELVNTNLAALQESAAELLSICHHRPGQFQRQCSYATSSAPMRRVLFTLISTQVDDSFL